MSDHSSLSPDECVVSAADIRAGRWQCSRTDHPTPTSHCHTTAAIGNGGNPVDTIRRWVAEQ